MPSEPCLCGAEDCPRCFPSTRSRKLAQALSSEDYARKRGGCCPVCRSGQIEGSGFDYDDNWVAQKVSCACGAEWTDLYVLEGYIDLDVSY